MSMVRISIIIPTYNEARYIGKTLESIKKQRFKDVEVIIADSNSSDGTRELARKTYKGIKVVLKKERGISTIYNEAAKIAKGDLLLFIDADTSISKRLLAAYDKAFRENGIVAATGPIKPLERTSWRIRIGYALVSVYLAKLLIRIGKPSIIASNMIISKEAFKRVGGFDTRYLLTYCDWDISYRLGRIGRVLFVKDAIVSTSTRRVEKWGALRYLLYHADNTARYHLLHKVKEDYVPIR